jgi:phospholipase C
MTTKHPKTSNRHLITLALAAGAWLATAASSQAELTRAFQAFPHSLSGKITRVIIIFPENRSFDSLYGNFPGANGLSNAVYYTQYNQANDVPLPALPQPTLDGMSLLSSGVDNRFPASLPNRPYDCSPYVPDNYVIGDMAHLFYLEQYQINNPAYTWISADPKNAGGPPMSKFSAWGSNPGLSLSHYDEQNGGEGAVAKEFVLADNAFHSAFGGSFLNHQWLIAARTPIWPANPAQGGGPLGGSQTPEVPASPAGQWWPSAGGHNYGYGATLRDNALTPDPTLPGFPCSSTSTNLQTGDFWAVNTLRPLRGPAGGYGAPATAPYLNLPEGIPGLSPSVTLTGTNGGTNTFSLRLVNAPWSSTSVTNRLPLQTYDTIGDRLNDAKISWAWFSGGWNNAKSGGADFLFQFHHQPFAFFAKYALAQSPQYPINGSTNAPVPGVDSVDPDGKPFGYGIGSANHLADEDADFYRMLDAGTLPQVSFVKPIGEDNSHPGYASVKHGQAWVANIVDRIKNSALWPNTVIFICYDEHGGLYDHVVPPVIDRWGPGLRVPFIIASPWSKKGYVDHNQYETVSMLAFIEDLFNLPPLNTRDANALPPVAAFLGEPDLFLEANTTHAVSFQVPAYNTPTSYRWSGNSDGLTLNPSTGLITGAPAATGKYKLNVFVNGSTAGLPVGRPNVVKYVLEIDAH